VGQVREGRIDRREFVRRLAVLGLAPSAIAALVAACGGDDDEARPETAPSETGATSDDASVPGFAWEGGTSGGEATVVWPDETLIFDPPVTYGTGAYYGLHNFYRGLTFFGGDPAAPEPQPDIAESVDVSSDGLRYNFKLKQGVTYHNGSQLVAADVKACYERCTTVEGTWAGPFLARVTGYQDYVDGKAGDIPGLKAVGDHEFEIQLDSPDATILGALAIPPLLLYPVAEVERLGDQWPVNPVGTGPYRLDTFDDAASEWQASRFEDYIYADKLPYLDTLTWQWNVTQELQVLRVQRGEADAMTFPPSSAIQDLQGLGDQFKTWTSLELRYFPMNVNLAPLDNLKVRQALNYAFNRERTKQFLVEPNGRYYPPSLFGFRDDLEGWTYDPEQAKALLDEGGYDGEELVALFVEAPTTPGHDQIWQLIQQDFEQVGVKLTLERTEGVVADHAKEIATGKYHIWHQHWGMGLPDPSELTSSLIGTKAPLNYGGYSNPDLDNLANQAIGESDQGARADLYGQIEETLLADAPMLFLGAGIVPTFRTMRVQNFYFEPIYWEHWDRYWVQD
jgi:ABC-type transport system substrate-binding protein